MISPVFMPKLTTNMREGTVVSWKKQEGDPVLAGDCLADIETGAAPMDLEAPGPGILRKVLVGEGQPMKIGGLIAVIAELDEDIDAVLKASAPPPKKKADGWTARRLKQSDVDVPPMPATEIVLSQATSKGTSPEKSKSASVKSSETVTAPRRSQAQPSAAEEYILNPISPSAPSPSPAESSVESKPSPSRPSENRPQADTHQTSADILLTNEIDIEEALRLLEQANHNQHHPISLTSLFLKAAATVLSNLCPKCNADQDRPSLSPSALAVAMEVNDRLVCPVIRDMATKTLHHITKESRALRDQAKKDAIDPDDSRRALFFIWNFGRYGVDPILTNIMVPHAINLGIGVIRIVPVIKGQTVGIGKRLTVSLRSNEQTMDTIQAARFLQQYKDLLEQPLVLFLPGDQPA